MEVNNFQQDSTAGHRKSEKSLLSTGRKDLRKVHRKKRPDPQRSGPTAVSPKKPQSPYKNVSWSIADNQISAKRKSAHRGSVMPNISFHKQAERNFCRDGQYILEANPKAYLLFSQIFFRMRWKDSTFLKKGQALIGDHDSIDLTRKQYRLAKEWLEKNGFASFVGTKKGTIVTILGIDTCTREQREKNSEKGHQKNSKIEPITQCGVSKEKSGAIRKSVEKPKIPKAASSVREKKEKIRGHQKGHQKEEKITSTTHPEGKPKKLGTIIGATNRDISSVLIRTSDISSLKKNPQPPDPLVESANAIRVFLFFLKDLKNRMPSVITPRDTSAWIKEFQKMLMIDGRTPEEIEGAISNIGGNFYSPNIQCPRSFRREFARFALQKTSCKKEGISLNDLRKRVGEKYTVLEKFGKISVISLQGYECLQCDKSQTEYVDKWLMQRGF